MSNVCLKLWESITSQGVQGKFFWENNAGLLKRWVGVHQGRRCSGNRQAGDCTSNGLVVTVWTERMKRKTGELELWGWGACREPPAVLRGPWKAMEGFRAGEVVSQIWSIEKGLREMGRGTDGCRWHRLGSSLGKRWWQHGPRTWCWAAAPGMGMQNRVCPEGRWVSSLQTGQMVRTITHSWRKARAEDHEECEKHFILYTISL